MQIGPFEASQNEKAKVKVKVKLNIHGIVAIESALVSKEIPLFCHLNLLTIFPLDVYFGINLIMVSVNRSCG